MNILMIAGMALVVGVTIFMVVYAWIDMARDALLGSRFALGSLILFTTMIVGIALFMAGLVLFDVPKL